MDGGKQLMKTFFQLFCPEYWWVIFLYIATNAYASELAASTQYGRDLYHGYIPWHKAEMATSNHLPTEFSACVHCHGPTGAGQKEGGIAAPALDWGSLSHGTAYSPGYTNNDAILDAIEHGKGRGGSKLSPVMPRFRFTGEERQALMDYLQILGSPTDQASGVTIDKVKVGALLPMDGATDNLGNAVQQGLSQVIAQVNNRGGIHGRQVELVVRPISLSANSISSGINTLIAKDHVYALVGSFTGNGTSQKDESEQLLANAHIANIAALNLPLKSVGLEDNWSAPLMPSVDEQKKWLAISIRQSCPDSSIELTLDDVGTNSANLDQSIIAEQQVFDDPVQMGHVLRQSLPSASKITAPYRILNFAGSHATTTLADGLSKLPLEAGYIEEKKRLGCVGYLPFKVGGLVVWPPGWTEVMVTPLPQDIVARVRNDKLGLWHTLGYIAGQILIEALAQAGPQLHERSLLEALPSLNGMELQPGLRLAYRRDHLHGLEPTVTIGGAIPKGSIISGVLDKSAQAKALFN
jgi:Periplasmic binding protein/Cytochrome C oxidase, cbb3-type, subunit III